MQITEAYHRLEQLEVEQLEKERELKVELLSTHQNLIANMAAWEQKYVFKAPFDGKVEFLKIYFRWSICAGRRSGIWGDTQGKPYIWSGVASGQWSRKCKKKTVKSLLS